ncbi:MAG: DUF58 domain-containing protein [Bacteroidetes bacterium]|nr:MAG: DUF58 domain-containing protein [Bacteroidota bacterium]
MKKDNLSTLAEVRAFGHIEFLAKQLVEGFITGLHRSPFHGFSVEFAEHRLYNTGETTRHIDWKVYAKTDRIYTKRYEEETNLRCQLLLDVSPSMYYPEKSIAKLSFGALASAAIAYMLQKQKDAVSLCTFADTIIDHFPTKSTPSHLNKLFIALQSIWEKEIKEPEKRSETDAYKGSVTETLHQIADKIPRRSLVVIFSDMTERVDEHNYEAMFSALQHLKHNQHEVLLFNLIDRKTELDLDFPNQPTIFVDIETGERLKLDSPAMAKQTYTEHKKAFYNDLKLRCGQYKIELIETQLPEGQGFVDVQQKINDVLTAYLIKRSKMK